MSMGLENCHAERQGLWVFFVTLLPLRLNGLKRGCHARRPESCRLVCYSTVSKLRFTRTQKRRKSNGREWRELKWRNSLL
jgi:hypothetical protein